MSYYLSNLRFSREAYAFIKVDVIGQVLMSYCSVKKNLKGM